VADAVLDDWFAKVSGGGAEIPEPLGNWQSEGIGRDFVVESVLELLIVEVSLSDCGAGLLEY
jgi:hypothetical protein